MPHRSLRCIIQKDISVISKKTKISAVLNYRSADKVYKEFMLYAIGRNINKYCRFLNEKLKKFEGKQRKKQFD